MLAAGFARRLDISRRRRRLVRGWEGKDWESIGVWKRDGRGRYFEECGGESFGGWLLDGSPWCGLLMAGSTVRGNERDSPFNDQFSCFLSRHGYHALHNLTEYFRKLTASIGSAQIELGMNFLQIAYCRQVQITHVYAHVPAAARIPSGSYTKARTTLSQVYIQVKAVTGGWENPVLTFL